MAAWCLHTHCSPRPTWALTPDPGPALALTPTLAPGLLVPTLMVLWPCRAIKKLQWMGGGTFTGEALQYTRSRLLPPGRWAPCPREEGFSHGAQRRLL